MTQPTIETQGESGENPPDSLHGSIPTDRAPVPEGPLQAAFRLADAIPMKFMILVIVVCLWKHEWYPFSHFPMYSRFGTTGVYYYVTDGEGTPVSCVDEFDFSVMSLPKHYRSHSAEYDRETTEPAPMDERQREIGTRFLNQLIDRRMERFSEPPDYQALQLWRVEVTLHRAEDSLEREKTLLAEVPLP